MASATADRPTQRSIVLVGFMAAGKSKIGRLLAERLALPFVDTDKEIEAAYGLTVAEIFRQWGEAEFRDAERALIARLLGEEPRVIAIGGGAFVKDRTREALNQKATTVWLDPPFELILARVARSTARPLATGKSEAELRQLWEARREFYRQAHVHVRPSDRDPAEVAHEVLEALAAQGRS